MTELRRRVSLAVVGETKNTLRSELISVACWRVGDGVFRFDHKIIHPSAKAAFAEFWRIRDENPDCPIALFGHADPTGNDDHNHDLAAERAQAVYAVLNRDAAMWYDLFASDPEARANLQSILVDYGLTEPEPEYGPKTTAAVERYIDDLGGGRALEPFDYLDDGLHALQSCSEFNPVVRAGKELEKQLDGHDRRKLDAVNRRVIAYFFEPGTYALDRWPCPVAGEGVAKCRGRFWSDFDRRRRQPPRPTQFWPKSAPGRPRKPFHRSDETFACRFYERIARTGECELVDPWRPRIERPPPPPPPPGPVPPPPIDPPDPPDPPDKWVFRLECAHSQHLNMHFLRPGVTKHDLLEVVPRSKGDPITLETRPLAKAVFEYGGTKTGATNLDIFRVPQVSLADPSALDIYNAKAEEYEVTATRDGDTRRCKIRAYPDAHYEYDLEDLRAKLRDKLWKGPIAIINEVGGFVADDFELKVMEKGEFSGSFNLQWQEYPGAKDKKPHWKAYRALDFKVVANPLISNKATLSVSVAKLLKKARKIPWLKKAVAKIPKFVLDRLESMSLEATFDLEGGGTIEHQVLDPWKTLTLGPDKSDGKAEFEGSFGWHGVATGDLDKLIFGDDGSSSAGVRIALSFGFDFTLGMILDIKREVVGGYLDAEFHGLDASIEISLPMGLVLNYGGGLIDPRQFKRVPVEFTLP